MYWEVGAYLSGLCADSSFGDKVIDEVAIYISNVAPAIKGFNRRGLYRMKQFYETYKDDEFVSALLTQISWTCHLVILAKAKTSLERHFYISLCIKEGYSSRELERQIDSAYYERYMLSQKKLLPEPIKSLKENPFLDSYVIDFLDLPDTYKEPDFRKAIIRNMKEFILEIGKEITGINPTHRTRKFKI